MIQYNIQMKDGKNVWRYRITSNTIYYERLWRDGKYVGQKRIK